MNSVMRIDSGEFCQIGHIKNILIAFDGKFLIYHELMQSSPGVSAGEAKRFQTPIKTENFSNPLNELLL